MREKKYLIKSYNQMFLIITIFTLILLVGGVSIAFFNYTRTGSNNTIKVGRIAFNTTQNNTINLTNVFPISKTDALTDNTNSREVEITITGDTTYTQGIEYLVTLEDVNITTSTNKKIPVGIMVTPEKTGELGINDNNYFTNRGGDSSIYKSFVGDNNVLEEGQYILAGYIRPGVAEVNGTIAIKAFLDDDLIAISDTYDKTQSDNMGTTSNWVNGRTVLTTTEWNSLNSTGISFKIKVEANEGIWVEKPVLSRNDMKNIYVDGVHNLFTVDERSRITEIDFIRMSEEMINNHENAIDFTNPSGEGVVKGWVDENKLYIASPGETYFPDNSSFMFCYYFPNIEHIVLDNINTSSVTDMSYMFDGLTKLNSIDLSNFDTSNVATMTSMFRNCTSLTSINIDSFDFSNVTAAVDMFTGCANITSMDLSKVKFSSITDIYGIFGTGSFGSSSIKYVNMSGNKIYNNLSSGYRCFLAGSNVEVLDISNLDASSVSGIGGLLSGADKLKTINASGMKFGSSVGGFIGSSQSSLISVDLSNADFSLTQSVSGMVTGNNNIQTINLSGANFNGTTSTGGMLSGGSSLTTINLSNTKFENVTNAAGMFSVSGLKNVDLSNASFENLLASTYMFSGSSNIESINLSNANFSSLTNATDMFKGLRNLTSINFSGIHMNNLVNMMGMFQNCTSLTSLDLSYINTSNVTNMTNMFAMGTSSTSNSVTTWTPNNNSLTTVIVGDGWKIDNVTDSDNMFYNCTSLVGGNGTIFDSTKINKIMAVIDTPTTPGYLTYIQN